MPWPTLILGSTTTDNGMTYSVPMAKTHETPIFLLVVIIDRHIQFKGRNSIEKSEKIIIPATVMYSADWLTQ